MNIEDVVRAVEGEVLTGEYDKAKAVGGCYVCDLLSLAMSKVSEGDAWITVQTNINIAAVAVLTEAACVVVAEGMHVEEAVVNKAKSEDVVIIKTGKSAFDAAMAIGKLL